MIWKTIFITFFDKNNEGGSSRWLVTPSTLEIFIENEIRASREKAIEECIASLPKILTPNVEPPPNHLSQNQILAAGQQNMLMRARENMDKLKSI